MHVHSIPPVYNLHILGDDPFYDPAFLKQLVVTPFLRLIQTNSLRTTKVNLLSINCV